MLLTIYRWRVVYSSYPSYTSLPSYPSLKKVIKRRDTDQSGEGKKKVIKRRDTDQSGEGEIKVFRPAPEGGEKRGNKTKKNLRYRINSIPSGTFSLHPETCIYNNTRLI